MQGFILLILLDKIYTCMQQENCKKTLKKITCALVVYLNVIMKVTGTFNRIVKLGNMT
jgi:hypothetical protein